LYGNHPYATPPEGLEATLNFIRPDDVRFFHRRYYVGANAVVAIVGALDLAEARALAEELIGGLPSGESAPALPEAEPLGGSRVVRVSHPSTQSHVLIGQIGVRRDDPDYFSLLLGNHILGGDGLISELAQEIRQRRGLSYSVGSSIAPLRGRGPFLVSLQTGNNQVVEAVEVATSTLRRFVHEGPASERIEAARQSLVSGFPLQIDSNREIVRYLAMIGFHRLPLDYLRAFPSRIEALSPRQVRDAARRRIQPDRLLTVIVGG
jgi:zinc protease